MFKTLIRASIYATLLISAAVAQAAAPSQYLVGFGHFTFGTFNAEKTGYWKTNFVFRNDSTSEATVTLHFFNDAGAPLDTPIAGGPRGATYSITVPAGGSRDIAVDPMKDTEVSGWAAVEYENMGIKGQAIFTQHAANGSEAVAVVPMVAHSSVSSIIPLPAYTNYSMPFDNTEGRVSSYGFANTTSSAVTMHAWFFGENGETLGEVAQLLPAFGHTAFATVDRFPGKKGTMRLSGAGVIPMGFRFNQASFTTWMER